MLSKPILSQNSAFIDSRPDYQNAEILFLTRRKELDGIKQEFVIIKALHNDGAETWVKLQRAAPSSRSVFRLGSLHNMINAKDQAVMSSQEHLLIIGGGGTSLIQAILEFD